MDDLVVIILTLLVATIGIISQSKKRQAANKQPQPGKTPQNFWDLLQSQVEAEQQHYEPELEFEQEDEPVDSVPIIPQYKFETENEGTSDIKEKMNQEISVEEKLKSKKEKFPLKKAVIYSEILNRKYI